MHVDIQLRRPGCLGGNDFDPVGLKLSDHRGFKVKSQQHFAAPKTAGDERPSPDPDLFIAISGNAANHDICAHFAGKTWGV